LAVDLVKQQYQQETVMLMVMEILNMQFHLDFMLGTQKT
jgi:hypothetical protein